MSQSLTTPRRRSTRPTITEVARAAGVAPATVSGVLNKRADCYASDQTRKRVIETARTLGYRPSMLARALAGKATMTLGLVSPGFEVEMTSLKFLGFEAGARSKGYMTLAASTGNDPALEDQAIRWLLDRRVDAIAVYPTETGRHHELRQLVEQGFPVVTFDGAERMDFAVDDVTVDGRAGGRLQVEHLLGLGRRRLAVVHSVARCMVTDHKLEGMNAAARDAGLPPLPSIALPMTNVSLDSYGDNVFEPIGRFLAEHGREVDGIAATGDLQAMGVIRYALELGLRVPQDIAVIGYDGIAASGHSPVPLSTVCHPSEQIGRQAFDLLLHRMQQPQTNERPADEPVRVVSPPRLIIRASTQPGAGATHLTPGATP